MREIKPLRKGSLARKILRAFGKDTGLESLLHCREKKTSSVLAYSPHYDYHMELKNAMLEAKKT